MSRAAFPNGDDAVVEAKVQFVQKLLNVLTRYTFDSIRDVFNNISISGHPPTFSAPAGQLSRIVELFFEKAVDEPDLCVRLCKLQVLTELRSYKRWSPFRDALLERSKQGFSLENISLSLQKAEIDGESNQEKRDQLVAKFKADQCNFVSKQLKQLLFIGQLYNENLLNTQIVKDHMNNLRPHCLVCNNDDGAEPFNMAVMECLVKLLNITGSKMRNCVRSPAILNFLASIIYSLWEAVAKSSHEIKNELWRLKTEQEEAMNQRALLPLPPLYEPISSVAVQPPVLTMRQVLQQTYGGRVHSVAKASAMPPIHYSNKPISTATPTVRTRVPGKESPVPENKSVLYTATSLKPNSATAAPQIVNLNRSQPQPVAPRKVYRVVTASSVVLPSSVGRVVLGSTPNPTVSSPAPNVVGPRIPSRAVPYHVPTSGTRTASIRPTPPYPKSRFGK